MALIPEKALPSASFCRQYCSRNQPDCLLPGSPSRLPLGCSRYITAGGGGWGIDFQRLWRRLHLYHFLWNRSYFLSQLCIIFIIAYWSKPGPLSKQRGNCSSSLWVSFLVEGTGFAVPVLREPLCVYQPASPHASFPAHTPVNHAQTREMRKQWLWSEDVERAELVVPDYSGHSSSVSAIPLLIKNYPYFYRVDSCMLFMWTALWHLCFKF